MADSDSQSTRGSHHASPTPSAHHNSNNNKHASSQQHAKAPTTTTTTAAIAATPKAKMPHTPSMSNIILLPSNVPVINNPYFGRPSPATVMNNTPISTVAPPTVATDTATAASQQQKEGKPIAGPLVGALLGSVGLVAVIIGVLIFIKRRKRRQIDNITFNHCNGNGNSRAAALLCQQQKQQQNYHFKREESTRSDSTHATLQPPPAYTPHSQKRLTAETLVDQRASMSTMNSNYSSRNHQYAPQLAYKQQQHHEGTGREYADWEGVSPSNTLIDTAAVAMATTTGHDDEKGESRRQRVPSYQPQVVVMTEPAEHATTGLILNNNETTSYYDYLYQHNNYQCQEEKEQQQQQHVNRRQQQQDDDLHRSA